ncbi:hypothetical protein Taro_046114 [Colocasia esculenta]|uniref:Nuclear nucleic acid-binding protein C1D n=1 Tax=Colocasia esculenta TaxID=4460 RepID=A0A843X744_COLES|nr:hypothetical protein [Colocasia esculenta]
MLMGGGRREAADDAVPESAVEALGRTLSSLQDLETHLRQFLSMADPEVLAELPPLQRAHVFLVLAKTTSALFAVQLRCKGVQPDGHPVRKELERISLYEEKFQHYCDWSRAPLKPSTTINCQAATRFIEHSLPDLTPEQRRGLKDIAKRQGVKSRTSENHGSHKRRKYQTPEKHSVRAAAQEFLEKAARELLGPNDCGLKGPLRNAISDEEDAEMS